MALVGGKPTTIFSNFNQTNHLFSHVLDGLDGHHGHHAWQRVEAQCRLDLELVCLQKVKVVVWVKAGRPRNALGHNVVSIEKCKNSIHLKC